MSLSRLRFGAFVLTGLFVAGCQTNGSPPASESSAESTPEGEIDRTTLPVLEPKPPTYTELDARNAEAPPRFEVTAPEGAPNVVIVLIDDLGFGAPSTFGGPLQTPTLDELARGRAPIQQLPHDGALLADEDGAQDGPQPPPGEHRFHHGDLDGVSGQHGRRSK